MSSAEKHFSGSAAQAEGLYSPLRCATAQLRRRVESQGVKRLCLPPQSLAYLCAQDPLRRDYSHDAAT